MNHKSGTKNRKSITVLTAFILAISIILGVEIVISAPVDVLAQKSYSIPSWIKTTAKWWSEGQITDDEFIKSMKFLVENKIINVDLPTNAAGIAQVIDGGNHYKINNDCQLVQAEFNDSNIGLGYQGFGSNVHQTAMQLFKDELQKNPALASNENILKSVQDKLAKQAFDIEIQKLENSYELNSSFAQEFTNDFWYTSTFNGQDLTPELIQEYNLTAPTGPTQEQIQNDPDCSMYRSIKNSNGGH